MLRTLAILLLLLSLPLPALAHTEAADHYPYSETLHAGPYILHLDVEEWPPKATKFTDVLIRVENQPAEELVLRFRQIPAGKQAADVQTHPLFFHDQYPGEAAWGGRFYPVPSAGEWTWEIEVEGPLGKGIARTDSFQSEPPPGLPSWVYWTLAYTPLMGLLWFEVRRKLAPAAA